MAGGKGTGTFACADEPCPWKTVLLCFGTWVALTCVPRTHLPDVGFDCIVLSSFPQTPRSDMISHVLRFDWCPADPSVGCAFRLNFIPICVPTSPERQFVFLTELFSNLCLADPSVRCRFVRAASWLALPLPIGRICFSTWCIFRSFYPDLRHADDPSAGCGFSTMLSWFASRLDLCHTDLSAERFLLCPGLSPADPSTESKLSFSFVFTAPCIGVGTRYLARCLSQFVLD